MRWTSPILLAVAVLPAYGAEDINAFLPADTNAVVTIQARKIAETPLGKKIGADALKELVQSSRQVAIAMESTGLDPLKDFERITVGLNVNTAKAPRPFALFEGAFDKEKIADSVRAYAKANPDKIEAVMVGTRTAYRVPGGKPDETVYAAIVDERRLVVAPTEADLSGAFAAANGGRKAVISKDIERLLATSKSNAPIFARAWVKGKLSDLKVGSDQLQARLKNVDWVTAAVSVTADVAVTVTLNAGDAAAAQQLSDLLGGLVGLVKLQIVAAADDQPELKPVAALLRATKVSPLGATVVANGTVKGAAIAEVLNPPKAPGKKK